MGASSYLNLPKRTQQEAAADIVRDYLKALARRPHAIEAKAVLAAFNVLHPLPVAK